MECTEAERYDNVREVAGEALVAVEDVAFEGTTHRALAEGRLGW